ncbi:MULTISPECIES: hypothetical protein [Nocardia]|uniref:Uncharacterized protein n=1 Tax=Nocardia elegans TaxID=300029 RepID=A0ABW6T7H5_9NOCA|nr:MULTISPECIES: hypothetical protein [Nocardia]MBF6447057.1 hypothetical protein [Nocardia elegans]
MVAISVSSFSTAARIVTLTAAAAATSPTCPAPGTHDHAVIATMTIAEM